MTDVTGRVFEEMRRYGRTTRDSEIVGCVMVDTEDRTVSVVRLPNVSIEPLGEFVVQPSAWAFIKRTLRKLPQLHLTTRFHSHPRWAAIPSLRDRLNCVHPHVEVIYSYVDDNFCAYTNETHLQRLPAVSTAEITSGLSGDGEPIHMLQDCDSSEAFTSFLEGNKFNGIQDFSDWCRRYR